MKEDESGSLQVAQVPMCLREFKRVLDEASGKISSKSWSEDAADDLSLRLLDDVKEALRMFSGIADSDGLLILRMLALRLYDLAAKLPRTDSAQKVACDLRLLSCRLQKHVRSQLQEKGEDHPSARQCRQREGLSLCTSFCHTATAYKEANDLEAAVNACESAAELMRELEASDDSAPEERTVVKLDLLFRQIEVTVPCCTSEEERQRTHALLNEARTIISSITSESADNSTAQSTQPTSQRSVQSTQPTSQRAASSGAASSRKFAILSFNLALLELKKIEPIVSEKDAMEKESYKNAAFWAASAAELFADCDDENKAEQALALAVLGKAFLIGGDHESAYSKLRLAYELNAENLYVSSAVTECLCQQEKWEGAHSVMGFLSTVITPEAYAAAKDTEATVRHWLCLINHVVKTRKFDLSNLLFEKLLATLPSEKDGDDVMMRQAEDKGRDNWETVYVAWIIALSHELDDLQKCEEIVDKFIRNSAVAGTSKLTKRKMLKICYHKVKALNDSGRVQRSIEWWKRALQFAESEDQTLIRRNIAKAALKMGDMETATSYMQCMQQPGAPVQVCVSLDDTILKLQIAAKSGDKEETRNLLVEISKKNPKQDGIRPVLVTEALAMACQTAYECGWSVLARDSLEFMIENVVLETSQPDVPELDVDMLLGEWLKLHACDSDDQRGRSTKIVTIFESVLTRLQASELSRFQDSTLVTIANRLDNIAISLHSVTYPKKEVGEPLTHNAECLEALEAMAKLWHLSAQFLLMIPSASDANEIETDAKQHLFQSAACNIIISRNINSNQLKSPRGKQRLQHALDCLTRLHELRDMEVPNDKSREDEFLMRLEVELLLQKNEAHLDKVVETYLQRAQPSSAFFFRALGLCKQTLSSHSAAAKCANRLANRCILVLDQSDHEQSTKIADLQLFRIMLRVQHGCHDVEPQHGPLLIWDEIFQAIKASSGKYPEPHVHYAAVHAYNFGVKAFYFGRKMEAEQWIGMAYKLTKNTSLCEKQTLEKISQAYDVVVGAQK